MLRQKLHLSVRNRGKVASFEASGPYAQIGPPELHESNLDFTRPAAGDEVLRSPEHSVEFLVRASMDFFANPCTSPTGLPRSNTYENPSFIQPDDHDQPPSQENPAPVQPNDDQPSSPSGSIPEIHEAENPAAPNPSLEEGVDWFEESRTHDLPPEGVYETMKKRTPSEVRRYLDSALKKAKKPGEARRFGRDRRTPGGVTPVEGGASLWRCDSDTQVDYDGMPEGMLLPGGRGFEHGTSLSQPGGSAMAMGGAMGMAVIDEDDYTLMASVSIRSLIQSGLGLAGSQEEPPDTPCHNTTEQA